MGRENGQNIQKTWLENAPFLTVFSRKFKKFKIKTPPPPWKVRPPTKSGCGNWKVAATTDPRKIVSQATFSLSAGMSYSFTYV